MYFKTGKITWPVSLQMGSTDAGVKEEAEGRASGCVEGGVTTPDMGEMEALRVVSEVVQGTDVSPFEIIHSGVITRLLAYLTTSPSVAMATRDLHLRRFLQQFLRCPVSLFTLSQNVHVICHTFVTCPVVVHVTIQLDRIHDPWGVIIFSTPGRYPMHCVNKVLKVLI